MNVRDCEYAGHVYASREHAKAAQAEYEAQQAAVAEARAERAAQHEAGLKAAFLAVPGATEDDWRRERSAILAADRQQRALAGDDAARKAQAAMYREF